MRQKSPVRSSMRPKYASAWSAGAIGLNSTTKSISLLSESNRPLTTEPNTPSLFTRRRAAIQAISGIFSWIIACTKLPHGGIAGWKALSLSDEGDHAPCAGRCHHPPGGIRAGEPCAERTCCAVAHPPPQRYQERERAGRLRDHFCFCSLKSDPPGSPRADPPSLPLAGGRVFAGQLSILGQAVNVRFECGYAGFELEFGDGMGISEG